MLKYVINRPIAVSLIFGVLVLAGVLLFQRIPITLLPDIEVPYLQVVVSYPDASAKTIEESIVRPTRLQLLQTGHLKDLWSTTEDGMAILNLFFDFQTDMSLAYIEVNEKLDQILPNLPYDLKRPQVLYAGLDDVPVMYISAIPKKSLAESKDNINFGYFCKNIIKRRLEQLPEVSLVDINGLDKAQINIYPHYDVWKTLGIKAEKIRTAIAENDLQLGDIRIKDGHYVFQVNFISQIKDLNDLKMIKIRHNGQIYPLGDLCDIRVEPKARRGIYYHGTERAVLMSVRKQATGQLFKLNSKVRETLDILEQEYEGLQLVVTRDQSHLLTVAFSNLGSSLLYGGLVAILVLFVAYRSFFSVLLISLVIPGTVICSIVFFYLSGLSINILSLSGLILGVGLMIDNSIIIIENIQQYKEMDCTPYEACLKGANEVIGPLLSSMLTTCSVFLPLLFLNGLSGALFFDQAISICIALFVSLAIAYFLLPTLFLFFLRKRPRILKTRDGLVQIHTRILTYFFSHRALVLLFFIGLLCLGGWFVVQLDKLAFPTLSREGVELKINWNENIDISENINRCSLLTAELENVLVDYQLIIGEKQFMIDKSPQAYREAQLILQQPSLNDRNQLKKRIKQFLFNYPTVKYELNDISNSFDLVFNANESQLFLLLRPKRNINEWSVESIQSQLVDLRQKEVNVDELITQQTFLLSINYDKLLYYNISVDQVVNKLNKLLSRYELGSLSFNNDQLPVLLKGVEVDLIQALQNERIEVNSESSYRLDEFFETSFGLELAKVQATKLGPALRLKVIEPSSSVVKKVQEIAQMDKNNDYHLVGPWLDSKDTLRQLYLIIGIAILMLYVVLSIQFESLILPLIILIIIPFSIAGSIIALYLFGQSLNIIAIIGIVVMVGIVVNDAILKIDMIQKRMKNSDKGLYDAIHYAGRRRIKPILMTSMTTILALSPILFSAGLGAELQKPLAISGIGGIIMGTICSLSLLPLIYFWVHRLIYKSTNVEPHDTIE